MDKKFTFEIEVNGLPEGEHEKLSVNLKERMEQAVQYAIVDTFDCGFRGKDWVIRMTST